MRGERQTLFDIRELAWVADALGMPRVALLGTSPAGTIEGSDGEGVEDVDRRQFGLTVFGTAMFATTASQAIASGATAPVTVGRDHVDYLTGAADQLWAHDAQFGSGGLVEPALTQCALARQLLDHGTYDPDTGIELATITGNLVDCAGWLAFDSGQQKTARDCFTEALILAERSGDQYLWSNVMDDLRHQAWLVGNMREALQLSLRVSDTIRHVPSARLQALHAARLAVAYAAVGDRHQAEAAIAHAWREVDRGLDSHDDPIWLHFVTPSEIQSITARAHTFLGEHDKAVTIYQESVNARNKPRDEASYQAYLASSLAGLGDTTAAIDSGLSALSLLEGPVTSPRLLHELEPVKIAAMTTKSDAAGHFLQHYDTALSRSSGNSPA